MRAHTEGRPPPPGTFHVEVACTAGYAGEPTPCNFLLGGYRVEVADVLDCWLALDHRYFKVLGDDGDRYILRHDSYDDSWELAAYQRGAAG